LPPGAVGAAGLPAAFGGALAAAGLGAGFFAEGAGRASLRAAFPLFLPLVGDFFLMVAMVRRLAECITPRRRAAA
jgi:hypothetical protein